jgi:hypothetical protein
MDRREIYKLVAEMLPRLGGAVGLLDAVADGMRAIRTEPASVTPELGELRSLLHHDDLLGQIYQAINAPALEAAYRATARERRKFNSDEIPAVTQLFTPKWVVEFLLQNTLGKLWLEIHPDSRLSKKWNWLVKGNNSMGGTPMVRAKQLRICDPACGTMNFGLVAIDMLREIYREEKSCAEPEIDDQIVRNNLTGFDIDPLAVDLARRSFEIKIGRPIAEGNHQLFVKDALFDRWTAGSFDVVVTNPPYLSARNLDAKVVRRLKERFPAGWRDYYACFMLRALEMLRPGGRLGILTMHSFMFTGAFERMRREIAERAEVRAVAHFGPGLFDVGNPGTLQTAAVVLERSPAPGGRAMFFRLVDADDKRSALAKAVGYALLKSSTETGGTLTPALSLSTGRGGKRFELKQSDLASLPRLAWMYWISPRLRRAFRDLPTLGEIAPPRQGLATTDNARFVRYWWEVEPPNFLGERNKWKPYAKGGRFRRWYESARHRVNWEDDGREIKRAIVDRYPYLDGQWQWVAKNSGWYGREGITYSYLTSGSFSARRLEAGTIFDVAGSSLFPDDPLAMLGVLNSSVARQILAAINPTVNFQVGDLRQMPVPRSFPDELRREVASAIECTRKLDYFDETSVDFLAPEPWTESEAAQLREDIGKAEASINGIVGDLYGMKHKAGKISVNGVVKEELARRWIGYALGVWLGRWGKSPVGDVAVLSPLDGNLRGDLRRILADRAGENSSVEIAETVGGLDRFLSVDFLPWHNLLYRGRPVFWGFSGNGKTVAVCGVSAGRTVMRGALREIGEVIPPGWRRCADDGVRINLAPLSAMIADRKLRESIGEVRDEMERGQFAFSKTARQMLAVGSGSA